MISFIIPTLNEEKTVEETLRRLASYSGQKEIIVSDGQSADRTVEIARRYANRVIVFPGGHRQTISEGKNDGAKAAGGDILVFLDCDVTIPDINSFFSKALSLFERDRRLVGLTVAYKVTPDLATPADRIVFRILAFNFFILNNVLRIGGSGGEFQMVRAEAFRSIGGFNQKLVAAEDNDLFCRLAKIGRTRCEQSLHIFHSGRRAHKIGWPRLLRQWFLNWVSVVFFNRSVSREWTDIR